MLFPLIKCMDNISCLNIPVQQSEADTLAKTVDSFSKFVTINFKPLSMATSSGTGVK